MSFRYRTSLSLAALAGSLASFSLFSSAQAATRTFTFEGVWDEPACEECVVLFATGTFSGQFHYDDATPLVVDTGNTYDTGHVDTLVSDGNAYVFTGGDEFILSGEEPGFGWELMSTTGTFWGGSVSENGAPLPGTDSFVSIYLPHDPNTDINPDFTLPLAPGDSVVKFQLSPSLILGLAPTVTAAALITDEFFSIDLVGHLTSLTETTKVDSEVPLPGALPLLAAGLAGLAGLSRRRQAKPRS